MSVRRLRLRLGLGWVILWGLLFGGLFRGVETGRGLNLVLGLYMSQRLGLHSPCIRSFSTIDGLLL